MTEYKACVICEDEIPFTSMCKHLKCPECCKCEDRAMTAPTDEYHKHRQYEIKMEHQIIELRELVKMAREAIETVEHYNNGCGCCATETVRESKEIKDVLSRIDASEVMK